MCRCRYSGNTALPSASLSRPAAWRFCLCSRRDLASEPAEWNLQHPFRPCGRIPLARLERGQRMQIGVETAKAVDQRRVFVVDDDEITRAALQFMLHDEIETHELASPEAAYDK